ncbi:hypothetical protein IFR04_010438 [Cadophora malorum]|uniref:Heterokaryon incompatibility domain-containing protein n=1 Tax=Cadophora malorum TaxID=108018 RepID=A0A8H7TB44_9HELO|nr:hypothetical protein IFR04_010438 [Cadophora malorum]
MDSNNEYTYTPLKQPDKTIRLLKILSTAPHISCQLSVVALADSPVFSALSYVWGDPNITELIAVDGGAISVTVNLASALRGVYGHWARGQHIAPGEVQWLWADALCINQQDIPEKNLQLPLMEKIYSDAHRVIAWLGSDDDEVACRAVDAGNLVWSKISQ